MRVLTLTSQVFALLAAFANDVILVLYYFFTCYLGCCFRITAAINIIMKNESNANYKNSNIGDTQRT